ncbi:MAG: hypothetical protein IJ220_05420 [Clostridia bacterium]|nr:hypothetical protein [Clostridia bacterium]
MKSTAIKVLMLILVFLMALPLHNVFASSEVSSDPDYNVSESEIEDLQTKNDFEAVISMFFLGVGDYAQDYLNQVFREEITVDKIVYNKAVLLNANFFNNSINSSKSNASTILREIITKWYQYFRKLALIVILISLIVVGIRYFIQTPESRVKARDVLKKVVMAVALVYFFPYVMRYAFDINEAIVKYIASKYSTEDKITAFAITQISDLTRDDLEFRSPAYISLRGMRVGAGSSEATQLYLNKLENYKKQVDVMRMMRAFGGVTLRFAYIIIWWIMLAQTYILTIIYLKRYLLIAFLIIVYPLVIIGYIVGGMFGRRQTAFNRWCGQFFTNVFLQTIHAIMYGTISGIIMNQVRNQLSNDATSKLNVILMIIATSFLFSGEKLLTRFWKVSVDDSERKGIKRMFGRPKRLLGHLKGK